MPVNTLLARTRWVFGERETFEAILTQVETLNPIGIQLDPGGAQTAEPIGSSDDIVILSDNPQGEIEVLSDVPDIRIVAADEGFQPEAITLVDPEIRILEEMGGPASRSDAGDIVVEIEPESGEPGTSDTPDSANIVIEAGQLDQDIIIDDLAFDEQEAERRLQEIKAEIEQKKLQIDALKQRQIRAETQYVLDRESLYNQYQEQKQVAAAVNEAENRRLQGNLQQLACRISQEQARIDERSQRLWFRILGWLGLWRPDTTLLDELREQHQHQQQQHLHQAFLAQRQSSALDDDYRCKLVERENTYRGVQQVLATELGAAYRAARNQLVPEGQHILAEWLCHIGQQFRQWHPDWADPVWAGLQASDLVADRTSPNPGLRVGTLVYDNPVTSIPALVDPISAGRHVLVQGGDREIRVAQMRAMLLRLLVAFPVGLARVLLIDGVDQGHALKIFAPKLHEDIAAGKVFDLEREIAEELSKVRNRISQTNLHVLVEHASIDSYNQANPEIPSPYHFVIIHDFPSGFNAQAQRTLQDIIRNGPRAGVFILATLADSMPRMNDFDMREFLAKSYVLNIDAYRHMDWNSEHLGNHRVCLDAVLEEHQAMGVLDVVSQVYTDKPTVLLYERIARDMAPTWSVPTTRGLQAPVGLTFGGSLHTIEFNDEFVHGLLGGRTGSGKTVLLHDLICGLTLEHSPEELSLYLLDFKGTEFSVYAQKGLPHARVVAVDCDEDVGLNIVRNLVQEISRRRNLFQDAGVADIRRYREQGNSLPRILLIIDEVQVLLQSSNSRLQRQVEGGLTDLLRRGRAMGIHVLLGTQSPSLVLPNQMLQQMAIRICLLADHQVSRLVLGEGNEAAATLQKQGEAVYNSYNGAPNKNVFIRAALIESDKIDEILSSLSQRGLVDVYVPEEEMLYFDGQSRSAIQENQELKARLDSGQAPPRTTHVTVPIGESIEIKEDTSARFSRAPYGNLIILGGAGEEAESAHALVRNILLGLCIQRPSDTTRFYVIDLTYEELPFAHSMRAFQSMPHEFEFARNSQLGVDLISEVFDEVTERDELAKSGSLPEDSIFLVVYGMENFGDLRAENRFDQPEARKRFEKILTDGPSLGVHVIAAAQTAGKGTILTVDKFGLRACFQCAQDDSQLLLDNDTGTKLERPDRAIYRQRDWPYGKVEKFKPYLPLSEETIRVMADLLAQRDPSGGH